MNLVQKPRDPDLLLRRVRDARGLLPVPQGFLPDLNPLWDLSGKARLDEVVVNQPFLRNARSPAVWRV